MLDEDIGVLSEVLDAQKRRAVVVVGRFQPPHCGHDFIIGKAKNEFKRGKYDAVFVVIVDGKESSKNETVNPLSSGDRLKYLAHLKNSTGVKFLVAESAFMAFVAVREAGYEPITIVGGALPDEDRAQTYKDSILDKHFNNPDGSLITHKAISIKRDKKSDSVPGVSGSIVRAAVVADRAEDFTDWVCLDSDKIASSMYKTLQLKLKVEPE